MVIHRRALGVVEACRKLIYTQYLKSNKIDHKMYFPHLKQISIVFAIPKVSMTMRGQEQSKTLGC